MTIYSMGFTQKSAEQFFNKISENKIDILVDIRLNNKSQLAGFAKGADLAYFLEKICGCKYSHEVAFAPTKDLLDRYKKGETSWEQYVKEYDALIETRNMTERFEKNYSGHERVLLLCSEPTPLQCHRRLLAEAICKEKGYNLKHI